MSMQGRKKDAIVGKARNCIADAGTSATEAVIQEVLENFPTIAAATANTAIGPAMQAISGGLISAVAPAVYGFMLSYQQKRLDHNIALAIETMNKRQDEIEARLSQMADDLQEKFVNGIYRDALLDNVVSQNQEDMVVCNTNAFVNLMSATQPNDGVVLSVFRLLSDMTNLDVRVLRLYDADYRRDNPSENPTKLMEDEDIDLGQLRMVREKLARLGMLVDKNDDTRQRNLEEAQESLGNITAAMNSAKPRRVREPKFKKVYKSSSFSITRLGMEYLRIIGDGKEADEDSGWSYFW